MSDITEYISAFPPHVRAVLREIRKRIKKIVPEAEERISYGMPAYFLRGALIYFGAFKTHIGIFPPVRDEKLKAELKGKLGPMGNVKLKLDEPIPFSTIEKIVRMRLKENKKRLERESVKK